MASAADIERELLDTLELKKADGEAEQKYLMRILVALDGMDQSQWLKMTKATQNWSNRAIECAKQKKPIPGFGAKAETPKAETPKAEKAPPAKKKPAADAKPKPKAKPAREEDDDTELPPRGETKKQREAREAKIAARVKVKRFKRPDGSGKSSSTKKTKPANGKSNGNGNAKKGSAEPQGRKVGAKHMILKQLTKAPTTDGHKLADMVRNKGFAITDLAVRQIRSDFLTVVRVLQEAGLCKQLKLAPKYSSA